MIMSNPSLLPVKDFVPTTTALISLGREIAVDVGGQAGYIDNLLVTNEGRLVVVETKLWRNPESTREVIVQTLQYGMALSAMSLRELESRLPLLKAKGQTISEFVAAHSSGELRVDDFEEALERNLRRGDMVYLIVSDGIRVGVERITHWLNEGGSAPFKFGLVELRFFDTGADSMLVVPRTLLKSREISRHVVIVDVQGAGAANAVASVIDDTKQNGKPITAQRTVKVAGQTMSKERLLFELASKSDGRDAAIAANLFQSLDALDLQTKETPTNFQYGVSLDDGNFSPLISFNVASIWSQPFSALIDLIGDEEFVAHKQRLNAIGGCQFYRPNEASDPAKRRNSLEVRYGALDGKEIALVEALAATRDVALTQLT
jgi:uncharacterized small protein (DUF1192 family)